MKKLIAMILLSGCVDNWARGTGLDPVTRVPTVKPDLWYGEVKAASDTWRDLMEPACYPFHMVADGEPGNHVILVPKSEWTRAGASGVQYDSGRIEVIGDVPYYRQTVLMHEIGHAMGLDHSSDVDSIMYPSVSADAPSVQDVKDAQNASDCGYYTL